MPDGATELCLGTDGDLGKYCRQHIRGNSPYVYAKVTAHAVPFACDLYFEVRRKINTS